jgi:uncharacterized protein (DUF983 family)
MNHQTNNFNYPPPQQQTFDYYQQNPIVPSSDLICPKCNYEGKPTDYKKNLRVCVKCGETMQDKPLNKN